MPIREIVFRLVRPSIAKHLNGSAERGKSFASQPRRVFWADYPAHPGIVIESAWLQSSSICVAYSCTGIVCARRSVWRRSIELGEGAEEPVTMDRLFEALESVRSHVHVLHNNASIGSHQWDHINQTRPQRLFVRNQRARVSSPKKKIDGARGLSSPPSASARLVLGRGKCRACTPTKQHGGAHTARNGARAPNESTSDCRVNWTQTKL